MDDDQSDCSAKYLQFQSVVDQSFWHKMCQLKLDVDRLEENERDVWGLYLQPEVSSVYVDYLSFNRIVDWKLYSGEFTSLKGLCSPDSKCNFPLVAMRGLHKNYNTLDNFKNCDKNEILSSFGCSMKEDIVSGKSAADPTLLTRFILLTFADLKKYDFYYWFSFPASLSCQATYVGSTSTFRAILSDHQLTDFFSSHEGLSKEQRTIFGLILEADVVRCVSLQQLINFLNAGENENVYLCFLDPSTSSKYPGWPLRNILALISYHWKDAEKTPLKIISLRVGSKFHDSPVFQVLLQVTDKHLSKWVGWEKNSRDKLGPRYVSLKDSMDPVRLADTSAELNLKLMKWRLAPNLDLDVISRQRVLILGAGTLGCALARNLMCWGVRKITFVDCGKVSYSNPVRQCLYNQSDCLQDKAPTAAQALKNILPSVQSHGEILEIPMPGHSTANVSNAARLHTLIETHDAVFLVTDSRESRWLPTLIAASLGKLAITSALGFDSYLVMRHGIHSGSVDPKETLGCYFCNDVTAPGDSSTDRTLDQQCTVSRPAVSNIAAALATELFVSLLQTPQKVDKSNVEDGGRSMSMSKVSEEEECLLGLVPHSIRGFLSSYNHMLLSTFAFSQCTACSSVVIDLYNADRDNFLNNVFQSNSYLEEVTGLSQLQKLADEIQDLSLSEEESDN